MKSHDLLVIVGVAAFAALVVGAVGLALVWLVRRRSFRWQLAVVAIVPLAGAIAGATAVARMMFLSHHDLLVMTVVTSVSAVVAIGVALVVGMATARWSEALRAQVRGFGEPAPLPAAGRGPSEIRDLSDELASTQHDLQQARARERRLEESRRELVSWVSHDLRTPLSGLRAMTEALEDGLATDPQRYHRQIRAEVDRMSEMVDDLFELSRIHAGVLRLAPEPVLLGDLVSDVVAGADAVARARRVRLGGRVEDGIELLADPTGLSRVVSNLLINAIRHTPADGVVEVAGRTVDDGVELSVTDGCGGLGPEEMARVFDVAWQGGAARTPGEAGLGGGAGLGLAIVKGIVEAHRGRVWVENRDGGNGCRFLVTLPA
ncbi:HAMP domain-containing sensor histidine kinase [Nocardioides panacisoli]|uniref:histidine kinase n=1 Tax=Nocardioides panacisoli TaxID=627624 RepID=A0ABP7IC06_9ACTN